MTRSTTLATALVVLSLALVGPALAQNLIATQPGGSGPAVGGSFGVATLPNAPAAPAADRPSRTDVLAGFCEGAGGGASSVEGPGGVDTTECWSADGEQELPPQPTPSD